MPSPTRVRTRVASVGRALRHRNYRLFFIGQGTSLVGTWITRLATSWLVYRLTGSAWLLGAVGFTGQLPTFLLAPFAGVIVDRVDRQRLLVVTQVLSLLQSAALAVLALSGTITVTHIFALAAVQGMINAFDTPARQSLVIDMIEAREDLSNAIALNSTLVNGARLIGPTIAGFLIAAFGEGWCFAIDAISYLAVIASLLMMRLRKRVVKPSGKRALAELREGWAYVSSHKQIRALLLLLAFVSLTGIPYIALMPIFASRVLGGGPHALGILMGASGLGAVIGALWLASRTSVVGLGRALISAGLIFGLGLIGFSQSRWMWLSVPMLVIAGGGMMVQMAASNTLLQTIVDDDKRGRVMSFYTMAFFGMTPFGSLLGGWLGGLIGAPSTVLLGGIATLGAVAILQRNIPERSPSIVGDAVVPSAALR